MLIADTASGVFFIFAAMPGEKTPDAAKAFQHHVLVAPFRAGEAIPPLPGLDDEPAGHQQENYEYCDTNMI